MCATCSELKPRSEASVITSGPRKGQISRCADCQRKIRRRTPTVAPRTKLAELLDVSNDDAYALMGWLSRNRHLFERLR